MRGQSKSKNCELTIDFGPFSQQKEPPQGSLFQRVKSEMLKRKERMALRRKPIQYQKLQLSLQQKLKQRSFNKEEQRDQVVMLEKCKNFFQLRRPHGHTLTPKFSYSQIMIRPHTSCSSSVHKQKFLSQIQGVMKECGNEQREIKQDMQLFTFYCKMMDRRLKEEIENGVISNKFGSRSRNMIKQSNSINNSMQETEEVNQFIGKAKQFKSLALRRIAFNQLNIQQLDLLLFGFIMLFVSIKKKLKKRKNSLQL